ncbi:MAG: daunorubicin ABC transporter ATP-binding protein, partial [Bacillus sp. (in: firmicutes)]
QKELEFQFLESVDMTDVQNITSGLPVVWELDQKDQIFTATVEDREELISQVIARIVASFQIKDVKINETSTEEIIRNIYEKGAVEVG